MNFTQRLFRATLVVVTALVLLGVIGTYIFTARNISAARLARRGREFARAESLLNRAWPLPGLTNAATLEWELLGLEQGDLANETHWRQRADADPYHAVEIFAALAEGNLATFRFNEALQYAQAILDRHPDDPHALWLRGRAWMHLQQEEKALADLRSAIEREPTAFEFRLAFAELLADQGFARQADEHFRRLHRERPSDLRVTLGLARCRQEQAELEDARRLLDDLLGAQPASLAALLLPAIIERSRLALRLNDPAEAERRLRQALELNPDSSEAGALLQTCLAGQGREDPDLQQRIDAVEQSRARLRAQLRDRPREAAVLADIGTLTARAGDAQEAAGWFFLALREDPHFAGAHSGLAEYFAQSDQPRRAALRARLAGSETAPIGYQPIRASAAAPSFTSLSTLPSPTEAAFEHVHALCAACHAYPPPESMPRAVWRKEVQQGYDFLRDSALRGEFPPLENVVLYYERRAPEQLPPIDQPPADAALPVHFDKQGAGWLPNVPPFPAIANLTFAVLEDDKQPQLIACDTRINHVMTLDPSEKMPSWRLLAEVAAPSHAAVADLDGDGQRDILVASLGEFFPTDDKVGSVVWLRGSQGGKFAPVTLLDGVGRVADVEAADFNADGRLDLVVAVFGWRKTGEILYLENQTTDWSRPSFDVHRVDARHGTIHVPVADLNADGRPDFVVLISQEHETVVAFLNQGDGRFRAETIFTAPHPSYGSSGIDLADLDADGDLDVVLTNGDVLDRPYLLKPYHGVQWLENKSRFPFTHHPLAPLYGASRAVAADFDGDQDLDIVAVSFLPRLEFPDRERLKLPSVLFLEQTAPRQFTRHVLESSSNDHFTVAAADFNADGLMDLALGNFSWKRSDRFPHAAVLWKSLGH